MPSEAFTNIRTMLAATTLDPDTDTVELRTGYDLLGQLFPPAEGVTVEDRTVGGVPGDWHSPPDPTTVTLLYLHGGGYVIGSVSSHRSLASHLARATGAQAFVADYRLAPEHAYPAAVDDAVAAYRGLLFEGIDASSIVIAGDSAGGGLTAATLVRLRDEGTPLPVAAVLISPWVDLTQSGESIQTVGDRDVMVQPALLERWAELYLVDADPAHPYASPLFADLTGLPPLLIHVGTEESLLDDARRLAEAATKAGVEVDLYVGDDMIHVWHLFAGSVPEADEAIAAIGDWVQRRVPA